MIPPSESPSNSLSSNSGNVSDDDEWKVLYTEMLKTKNYPETLPPIREIVKWVAKLGEFLARENDLEPDPIALWKGWKRLFDLAEGWRFAHEFYTCG